MACDPPVSKFLCGTVEKRPRSSHSVKSRQPAKPWKGRNHVGKRSHARTVVRPGASPMGLVREGRPAFVPASMVTTGLAVRTALFGTCTA